MTAHARPLPETAIPDGPARIRAAGALRLLTWPALEASQGGHGGHSQERRCIVRAVRDAEPEFERRRRYREKTSSRTGAA